MPKKREKSVARKPEHDDLEEDEPPQASNVSNMLEDEDMAPTQPELGRDASLYTILKELREFRKDSNQKLSDIREDIGKIYKRVEEAEERINSAETRIQSSEEILTELVKLQMQTEAKLTDLEGRSRRDNVRIFGVKEGAEENTTMTIFVEDLLMKGLELPASTALNIERAHRALTKKPPPEAPPRSIVVKFASFKMKEEILKIAWQKKGFDFQEKRIHLDHDYAPELLRKRRDYAEAKAALKEKNIRFQTPFPARLRVFYDDGTVIYNSAETATADMAKRGIKVTVLKHPTSLLDQITHLTWQPSGRRGNRTSASPTPGFKERLQEFRRQDTG